MCLGPRSLSKWLFEPQGGIVRQTDLDIVRLVEFVEKRTQLQRDIQDLNYKIEEAQRKLQGRLRDSEDGTLKDI